MTFQPKKLLKITSPAGYAAGPKAVWGALHYIQKRTGIVKGFKLLSRLNQKNGIDCPGCAWPDPESRSCLGEFCENGVKAVAEEAMNAKAGPGFFANHSITELLNKSDYWLGQQGRLTHPMIVEPGDTHYRPVSWERVFEILGHSLKELEDPNEAVFYTSGRTGNEAAFLYQLFVRMLGTNNLPDCSNMCHESTSAALSETVGIGKGSVTLEDFDQAELIVIMGQNPGTNHPRMLSALEKAKKNGAVIATINPLKEAGLLRFRNPQTLKGFVGEGTSLTDLYLQVKINEDVPLLKAVMKKLLDASADRPEVIDSAFIRDKTSGYAEFRDDLDRYDYDDLVERTGLKAEEVESLVRYVSEKKRIIVCWAMGLTQHKNGVDNIREIVNLLLLKGSVGKPGAGTCPVRGHSNVQGDRTMGIHERPSKKLLDNISKNFGFTPPGDRGCSVIEAIEAMDKNQVRFFFALGGNFVPAAPDTYFTERAVRKCDLTAHVSTKLNRSHLVHGKTALILPCLGRTDKQPDQTVENSMGIVHPTRGVLSPPSDSLLTEVAIICRLAGASLPSSILNWEAMEKDYGLIRKLIEKTIAGFENFSEKARAGFELYNGARIGVFHTSDSRAHFTVNQPAADESAFGKYIMMTLRTHDQFNTTVYGLDDRYRGVFGGRQVVFMNRDDMQAENLGADDVVNLQNRYPSGERKVEGYRIVPYDIPRGCVATYYPETNPLVPLSEYAHTSLTPASKSVRVDVIGARTS